METLKNLSLNLLRKGLSKTLRGKKALPKKYKIEEGNIQDSLMRLEESGKIKKVEYRKKVFWLTMEEKRGKEHE